MPGAAGTIADGAEDAHVKGRCVLAYASRKQVEFKAFNEIYGEVAPPQSLYGICSNAFNFLLIIS